MANPLVEFNDSQVGVYLGSLLHTLGAIGFLGGLVAYLAWHRGISRGHHHRRVLESAMALTYLSIFINLVGGFMRTFESAHPHLWQFAESAWVRAISIKHVFLFAGMGAAVYLLERVAPRLVRAHKAGQLTAETVNPAGHRIGVVLVGLGILLAAVLGSVTGIVPLVSADAEDDAPPTMDPGHDHPGEVLVTYANATGTLNSIPPGATPNTGTFQVPNGTVQALATLTWSPAQFTLDVEYAGPEGAPQSTVGGPGRLETTITAPEEGAWTYTISSQLAVNAQWSLSIRLSSAPANETFLSNSVAVAPGQFYEINTQMPLNASMSWSWTAGSEVYFDVHSHFDDEVQVWVEEDAATHDGTFTNQRAGGYSLLWDNTGTLPVTLRYRVWGDFEVDSIFPA